MADPTYSINGGSALPGVIAEWQRAVLRQNPDGTITYSPWAVHAWQLQTMATADFATLYAQQGKTLTSLETNDIDDRNVAATYTDVVLQSVVNGDHRGLNMHNIALRFRVKVV